MIEEINELLKGDITPSTWFQMSEDDYRAINAINHSKIKYMSESPAKFKWNLDHPKKATPAMQLGRMIHKALLEPMDFDNVYKIQPKFDKRTKKGKELFQAWQEENKSVEPISEDDFIIIERIINTVDKDPFFSQFFNSGIKEQSFFSYNDKFKLWQKCRVDNYLDSANVIVDIKTTDNAQIHSFNIDITKYSYLTQAAWYYDIVSNVLRKKLDAFIIIAVEKGRDNDMQAYFFDKNDLELGRNMYEGWLETLVKCTKTNKYDGYKREFIRYKAPEWLLRENGVIL